MERGDIRWYRFARPDKRRPVLLLTRNSIIPYLGEVTIAPITSTIRGIPTEVVLDAGDSMPRECAINLDHIQTVPQSRVGPLITKLSAKRWAEVYSALLFALGFR